MKVSLNYGNDQLSLDVPDNNYMGSLNPREIEGVENPDEEVKEALANPIGSKKLKELAEESKKIIILVSDISRPSPSSILLPPILTELREAGVKDDQIQIIFLQQ